MAAKGEAQPPIASAIVPVKDEEQNVGECLRQLLEQTYPRDRLEILIVDGMSRDGTRELVRTIMASEDGPSRVRLLDNPKVQRAAGLNVGIRQAKGDILLRLDARTRISRDYVSKCVETLLRTGAANVGGVLKPVAATPTQEAIGLAMSHPFGAGNAQFRLGEKSGFVDTVYPGCFRKEIFDRIGLFDEDAAVINEDSDLNQRIRESGDRVYLSRDIEVYYYPRETLTGFWKLYFRYGGGRAGNFLKHRTFSAWRQLGPPGFLLCVIGCVILSPLNPIFPFASLALLGVFLLTNLLVSVFQALRVGKIYLAGRLFAAYLCIHFGYALGFFTRLFQRPKPGQYWRG